MLGMIFPHGPLHFTESWGVGPLLRISALPHLIFTWGHHAPLIQGCTRLGSLGPWILLQRQSD